MTQEQIDGLKTGDKVSIQGTLCYVSGGATWVVDVAGGRIGLGEKELLGAVELELPRPSAPEGYEEFWPVECKEIEPGMLAGDAIISLVDIERNSFDANGPFVIASGVLFSHAQFLGVHFYRPIKKEPEERPERFLTALPDGYKVVYLTPGIKLPEDALCLWPHTPKGWEDCGGQGVLNGPIYAVPKGEFDGLKARQGGAL